MQPPYGYQQCAPQLLPSANSAIAAVQGQPGAWVKVGLHWVARSALIALGMRLAGMKSYKNLAIYGLAGGTAIEIVVLALAFFYSRQNQGMYTYGGNYYT